MTDERAKILYEVEATGVAWAVRMGGSRLKLTELEATDRIIAYGDERADAEWNAALEAAAARLRERTHSLPTSPSDTKTTLVNAVYSQAAEAILALRRGGGDE